MFLLSEAGFAMTVLAWLMLRVRLARACSVEPCSPAAFADGLVWVALAALVGGAAGWMAPGVGGVLLLAGGVAVVGSREVVVGSSAV